MTGSAWSLRKRDGRCIITLLLAEKLKGRGVRGEGSCGIGLLREGWRIAPYAKILYVISLARGRCADGNVIDNVRVFNLEK